MQDGLMEVVMLLATCLALAWMFFDEGNLPSAVTFVALAISTLILLVSLIRARRRNRIGGVW
jgi:hypothetical protein